jgi:hypothetical protein
LWFFLGEGGGRGVSFYMMPGMLSAAIENHRLDGDILYFFQGFG